jgi:hypothetical protein
MAENSGEKLHAACDECSESASWSLHFGMIRMTKGAVGTRKLKCSGHARCSRCEKEGIRCVYSPQKQMGRPRKRRREATPAKEAVSSENVLQIATPDFDASAFDGPGIFDDFRMLGAAEFADFTATSDSVNVPVGQHIDPGLTNGFTPGATPSIE